MVHSMTAFAKIREYNKNGEFIWEIRSVNSRFLDISIRLLEQFRDMESTLRSIIASHIHRGKIDCTLSYNTKEQILVGNLELDLEIARKLLAASNKVLSIFKNDIKPLQVIDVLKWPGVLCEKKEDTKDRSDLIIKTLQKALLELDRTRAREGKKLESSLISRIDTIEKHTSAIQKKMPGILKKQKDKLISKLSELRANLDCTRLEQEMVYFAQRIDISEELERLQAHCTETRRILRNDKLCGRRLDFLMQEFNREANTIASKSVSEETTKRALELKVLIEQMREQIQNIE